MNETMRGAFEAWYLSEADGDPEDLAAYGGGDYFFHVPRVCWLAWQAALQSSQVATLYVREDATHASYALEPLSVLPLGKHDLYTAPQPAQAPEGWKLKKVEAEETTISVHRESDGRWCAGGLKGWIGRDGLLFEFFDDLLTAAPSGDAHPDDMAVDRFALAMKRKLEKARAKGRGGWDNPEQCTVQFLADLLLGHIGKGNPGNFEDIANLAMMLHQRGADPSVLSRPSGDAKPVQDDSELPGMWSHPDLSGGATDCAPKHHTLKTDPAVFHRSATGRKPWEIRLNDRDFQVGETVTLQETKHSGVEMRNGAPLEFTGNELTGQITYVLRGPKYGLADGWCIFSVDSGDAKREAEIKAEVLESMANKIERECPIPSHDTGVGECLDMIRHEAARLRQSDSGDDSEGVE